MTTADRERLADIDSIVATMVDCIADEFDPERILLFGSRARDDANHWGRAPLIPRKRADHAVIVDVGLTVVGLGVLLAGAWLLVRSATHLATAFGLSPVIIGVTVVAFGTSAPEFVVSVTAAAGGAGGLAVGNVFGSNVMNVALVIGIAAALNPLDVDSRLLRRELPILGGATILGIRSLDPT